MGRTVLSTPAGDSLGVLPATVIVGIVLSSPPLGSEEVSG